MYKQIIIARKDLYMSPGKLAAQVAHASTAFLTNELKDACELDAYSQNRHENVKVYLGAYLMDEGLYKEWICGSFTKCVLEASNKNQLLKAVTLAENLGFKEGKDFFLIKDNCSTELEPEEYDEKGVGRTLTCIGFKPMESEIIDKICKKFQLYK